MTTSKKKTTKKRAAPPKTTAERVAPFKREKSRAFGQAKPKTEARTIGGRPVQEQVLEPRRERRALSHVGGRITLEGGSPEEQQALGEALSVRADESDVMADVHGFHSYPARLHPLTAQRLIAALSKPGGRVLDPFCGSGTVLVEARALGREALGSDLNPLAVELAWLKSRGATRKFASDLVQTAYNIAEVAEERRLSKADPHRRYDDDVRDRYPIHILLELDSITHGIEQLPKTELSRMLRLVVSSTLTKLAYSEGDTTRQKAPRRLPSGFAIQLFADKANELGQRLDEFAARVPERTPRAFVTHADARELGYVDDESIDLIVTSPPYPGVYDYLDHHLHRLRWLGLKESRLAQSEIGSRREYRRMSLDQAAQRWQYEIGEVLREMRRVLARDGRAVMIIADSVVDRQPLYADEQIEIVAPFSGMKVTAIASQERPLFLYGAEQAFKDRPRREHVVILRPGPFVKRPRPADGDDARRDDRPRRDGPPRGNFAPRDDRPRRDGPPRGNFAPRDDRPRRDGPPRVDRSSDRGASSGPGARGHGGPARPDRNRSENQGGPQRDSKPRGAWGSARPTAPRTAGSSDRREPPRKGPGPKGR